MKARYRLMRRNNRGGAFYCVDSLTKKRTSLETIDEECARQLIEAKNIAERQPNLNLAIAKAYLAGTDSGITKRTWRDALEAVVSTKLGANQDRWKVFAKDDALRLILQTVIVETRAEGLLQVLKNGTVSTNVFLRRLHNFCVDMGWLPWPIIPKRQWPAVRFKEKRAITWDEHLKIIDREGNRERRAYYELAWHLGASQTDLANLAAEDIDFETQTITFFRQKTAWRGGTPTQIRFGSSVKLVLSNLPRTGPLFPYLRTVRERDRATEFRQRCRGLGIEGVTLHSYRYAWAERAKVAGYPERYAQMALGHNSKAVHRANAKQAQVTIPPLEEYEIQCAKKKIVRFNAAVDQSVEAVNF